MSFSRNIGCVFLLSLIILWISCNDDPIGDVTEFPKIMEIPTHFPAIEFPDDNAYTPERWALGKKLFYDVVMSVDSSVSCASCHQQSLAFADDVKTSIGAFGREGTRNAPSLANVAYQPYLTREGGVPSLEMQVLVPIQEHDEFDFNIVLIADRLATDPDYIRMAEEAYNRQPDPYVISYALANFERSLISGNSAYDQYILNHNTNRFDASALRGMELFFSEKTQCSECHSGIDFTNYAFENNGLYMQYEDEGRRKLTGNEEDEAKFKVPGLRNIALTAPYMHDGSLSDLSDVIEHYDSGLKNHPNKNPILELLELTDEEKSDLIRFLESLTDEIFISNPIFKK